MCVGCGLTYRTRILYHSYDDSLYFIYVDFPYHLLLPLPPPPPPAGPAVFDCTGGTAGPAVFDCTGGTGGVSPVFDCTGGTGGVSPVFATVTGFCVAPASASFPAPALASAPSPGLSPVWFAPVAVAPVLSPPAPAPDVFVAGGTGFVTGFAPVGTVFPPAPPAPAPGFAVTCTGGLPPGGVAGRPLKNIFSATFILLPRFDSNTGDTIVSIR